MSRNKALSDQYMLARQTTSFLCRPLKEEDFVVQPVEDVSPPKWHLGHTTWFFEKFILEKFKPGYEPYNSRYNYFFNSYYESAGDRVNRKRRGDMTRPTTNDIVVYREFVNHEVLEFLDDLTDVSSEILDLLELGIQHEQQHQELLLTDIKYILGHNPLYPVYSDLSPGDLDNQLTGSGDFHEIGEGLYEIGHGGKGFSFDNELLQHKVYLPGFKIMDRPVTNGEFLEFILDGGYREWRFWLAEAWDWVNVSGVRAPLYWNPEGDEWYYYTLSGYRKLDLNAPVCHISYFEADAYASWKDLRLPTEAEWETACLRYGADKHANLLESGYCMPLPGKIKQEKVHQGTETAQGNMSKQGMERSGQFYGDVWEWTGSSYLAYPGYVKPPGAVGEYNGKFMINQMVLRGGSCATPASHIRPTYRNFFQTNKRWQFSGFRLAETTL